VVGRTTAGKTQAIVNLAYVSIFLGALFSIFLAWAWLYMRTAADDSDPAILDTPYFIQSLHLYGIAAIFELLAEPCFVVAQQKSEFKIRATAESIATVLRCLITCMTAIWAAQRGQDLGVLPFALGQGIYALSLPIVYYYCIWNIASTCGFSLVPRSIYSSDRSAFVLAYFPRQLVNLGTSLFGQSIFKHLLTQGDTLLISSFATQKAQGVYALANNYGGLVARLILQPVEEMSRNYFGKLLYSEDGKLPTDIVKKASTSLHMLLRSYILVSVAVVAVGPTVAPLLLGFIAGPRWIFSGAGHVLGIYCYYIPLLAINGVTEAFVSSVANESEVIMQSAWMGAFAAGFAGASYFFLAVLNLGAEGLVWANSLNMVFRIVWSGTFVKAYCKRHGVQFKLGDLFPRGITIAFGVATYAVLARLQPTFTSDISSILKSGFVAVISIGAIAVAEKAYILECYRTMRGENL